MSDPIDALAATVDAVVRSQRTLEDELVRLKVEIARLQTNAAYNGTSVKDEFRNAEWRIYRFAAGLIVVLFLFALCDH